MVEEASSNNILLKTADGEVFEVEPSIVKEMQTVQSFIDLDTTIVVTSAIPLPNVYGRELARIIKFCRLHRESGTGAWEFVEALSEDELKELLLATDYLNVKKFFKFPLHSIVNLKRTKSFEFMKMFFQMFYDFTLEEEARFLRQRHS